MARQPKFPIEISLDLDDPRVQAELSRWGGASLVRLNIWEHGKRATVWLSARVSGDIRAGKLSERCQSCRDEKQFTARQGRELREALVRCKHCGQPHWRFKKCAELEVFRETRKVVPIWKTNVAQTWGDRTLTVERNRGWGDRSQRSPTFWNKEEPDGPQEAA